MKNYFMLLAGLLWGAVLQAVELPKGDNCARIETHIGYWGRFNNIAPEGAYHLGLEPLNEKNTWMMKCILDNPCRAAQILTESGKRAANGDLSQRAQTNEGKARVARGFCSNFGGIKEALAASTNQDDVNLVVDYMYWGNTTYDPLRRSILRSKATPAIVELIDKMMGNAW